MEALHRYRLRKHHRDGDTVYLVLCMVCTMPIHVFAVADRASLDVAEGIVAAIAAHAEPGALRKAG